MASMSMAASLLPSSSSAFTRLGEKGSMEMKQESSSGRRDLVFAAAAAAVCSFANVAMGEEPKPGTPEAKKKYAPICVTMPTARICRK
ncbi:hypothetical protein like AT1G51400 [Hibiscus trionum]|uniref:Photosystem II 5 kDa protein, chloroplastic n=1 Tax=Hibiscus trionum TaxID=183268 RepID=A0A9W7ME87_HIBTR|nr:hypothetical protein like AT1G51400 [Hibiscus trionum]